ncbi:hypothetical protein Harman_38870 [Haloarcula mannanilytica]|uniref:Uncharacterized protein n=1 Tax=Haloarcula mannanilytica TaxID=2509225 RepID=A0A4C2ENX0_9EURY|nr:hypothetical protein [Haloarcula mannanilytica]GCF15952.1 hypothetical protein Harman_38870 [Haloarcula mannanilytica]
MSTSTQDFCFDELDEINSDINDRIKKAEQQVKQWEESKKVLLEIDEKVAHFDSIACGSVEVNESRGTITAVISAPEIGERVRELHQQYHWNSFEVDHLPDLGLFQVQMEMPLLKLEEGLAAPARED